MDKGCANCSHAGTPIYKSPCSECVDHKGYPMWERMLTELSQTAEDMKPDTVNHPTHYTECSLECIDVMLAVFGRRAVTDFCILNAFKYMWRYDHKNGLEDLQKAERYLAMATTFQMGDAEHEIRIIYMQEELKILMKRANE